MKKILSYFQYHFAAGVLLLASFSTIPTTITASPPESPDSSQTITDSESNSQTSESDDEDDEDVDLDNDKDSPKNDNDNDDEDEGKDEDKEDSSTDQDSDSPLPPFKFTQDLIINALNPGYTVENNGNKLYDVGEFIELQNLTDTSLVLAGYSLRYTNSTGKTSTLFTFPEGSYLAGKHLLLRYKNSPEAELSDAIYTSSLAMKAGPLELYYQDELVDTVCWTAKTGCENDFKNDTETKLRRTTLVRNMQSGSFTHTPVADYEPAYDATTSNYILPSEDDDDNQDNQNNSDDKDEDEKKLPPKCRGLEITELLSYYEDDKSEQFIEFSNPTSQDINLEGCKISYKNKLYSLEGVVVSGKYLAYYQADQVSFTKNPTKDAIISLVDADGETVDELTYGNGQKKTTSYAKFYNNTGQAEWRTTYAITPGAENVYQKYRTCEEGKIINEATGNCVNAPKSSSTTLAACPAGQYRNPLTNRCKKIETASTALKECAEGYERNPETNRCRKITSTNDGADYPVTPTTQANGSVFIGLGIVGGIVALGGVYVVLQFRHEITRALRKLGHRCNHIREDLLSRTLRRDRHK